MITRPAPMRISACWCGTDMETMRNNTRKANHFLCDWAVLWALLFSAPQAYAQADEVGQVLFARGPQRLHGKAVSG